jgi:hypothetical protein
MKQHRAELLTKWRGLISEQSQSGQTVRAFCHDRGLRDSLFYDWKKRLREAEAEKFVEVRVKDPTEAGAGTVPGDSDTFEQGA